MHAWETFILIIINPVHFKILLKKQKLKHGNICKVILKTFFQNTSLSLQYAFKLESITPLKISFQYLVIGQRQNFLGLNWNNPAGSIQNVFANNR